MEKHSGRHRKRRQSWGEQVRWIIGAVLAALLCGPTDRSTRPVTEVHRPMPSRRVRADREPAPARTAVKKRASIPQHRTGEGQPSTASLVVPPQRSPYTGPRGWCEDDDGVRGVRLYLVRHEDLVIRTRGGEGTRAHRGKTVNGRGSTTPQPPRGGRGGGGEFAELAFLVRRWQAIST